MESGKNLKNRYCCVIPVYNNFPAIGDVVHRALRVIDNVLIVDDGSTDADLTEVFKLLPVEVIRHDHNRGKGAALCSALKILKERNVDYMITIDGDGQHYPEDIAGIIDLLEAENFPVLLAGVRDLNHPAVPGVSRWGRACSNFFIRLETGVNVQDSQCGVRAYPVNAVSEMNFTSKHYDFETEILLDCAWSGMKIVNFPVNVYYPQGRERISHYCKIKDTCRIIRVHVKLLLKHFFHRSR